MGEMLTNYLKIILWLLSTMKEGAITAKMCCKKSPQQFSQGDTDMSISLPHVCKVIIGKRCLIKLIFSI